MIAAVQNSQTFTIPRRRYGPYGDDYSVATGLSQSVFLTPIRAA